MRHNLALSAKLGSIIGSGSQVMFATQSSAMLNLAPALPDRLSRSSPMEELLAKLSMISERMLACHRLGQPTRSNVHDVLSLEHYLHSPSVLENNTVEIEYEGELESSREYRFLVTNKHTGCEFLRIAIYF